MGGELSPARVDEFVRAPVGRWAAAGSTVVWCRSPSLTGSTSWGRPTVADTRAVLRLFDVVSHPQLAARFDCVLDAEAVDGVDDEALRVLVEWLRARRQELARRVRLQIGVLPAGDPGVILSGLWGALGHSHPTRVVKDARAAYSLVPDGAPLREELLGIVAAVRGVAPEVRALRELLRLRDGDLTLADAARALGTATRSLQRVLRERGTTFREEQTAIRFAIAGELLAGTQLKVAAIAARLGLTESGLEALVRGRSGMTLAEYRRAGARRGGPAES